MPVWVIVLLSIAAALALLLAMRIRLVLTCRDTLTVKLRVLCFSRRLYPRRRPRLSRYSARAMEKRAAKKARKSEKRAAQHTTEKSAQKPSPARRIKLLATMVRALTKLCRRHLSLRAAWLNVRVATGDAASTALLYGTVSAALAYLVAALENVARVHARPPQVRVTADYLRDTTVIEGKIVLSLSVGGALAILFGAALTYLKRKNKIQDIPRAEKA